MPADPRKVPFRLVPAWGLVLAAPLLCAVLALWLGKGVGWDLLNYHWYNPYALLHQRLGFDVAVAHVATYYNPALDLPLYLLGTQAPAWVVGAVLGALFGVAVALIGAIAWQLLGQPDSPWRLAACVLLAVAGAVGGGALPSLGDVANDVPVALGVFAALWLLLRAPALRVAGASLPDRRLLLAGACAGVSVGLKLTTGVYAAGLLAAVLALSPGWWPRLRAVVVLGAGLAAGFLLCAGPWLWRLWRYSGNPLFPYFNHWLHSPLGLDSDYRDLTFINGHWGGRLLFPWLFTVDSHRAAEWIFRDAHVLCAYVLVPVALLLMWRRRGRPAEPALPAVRPVLFLFVFAAASYIAWLQMFSIYRYLIPLEMLAPLLIALAILQWPLRLRWRLLAIALVLVAAQSLVKVTLQRQSWSSPYVSVQAPSLPDPQHSLVLMAGTAPMAYVIPAFPENIPFLRIDGWFVPYTDRSSGLARQMRQRVAAHAGPLWMLYRDYEHPRVMEAATDYGLRLTDNCLAVTSSVAAPLRLCELARAPLR